MALIATTPIPVDGFAVPTPLPNAASGGAGDEAVAGDGVVLAVRNASVGAVTVTVRVPAAVGGIAQYDVIVAATNGLALIPLGVRNFHPHDALGTSLQRNTNANDRAHWTYSATASVTCAVYQLPS